MKFFRNSSERNINGSIEATHFKLPCDSDIQQNMCMPLISKQLIFITRYIYTNR